MEQKEQETDIPRVIASPVGNLMESRTSHLDDILNEKLESAFDKPTSVVLVHEVAKIASEYEPVDLAHAVTRLPPQARPVVYENLPDLEAKVIFIINTDSATRSSIFHVTSDQEILQLLNSMPLDEAAWCLDNLNDRRLRSILSFMPRKKREKLKELLHHDRNSAARMMTSEFFVFHMDLTIGDVATAIRNNPGIDLTRRIFVLNDANLLAGYVPARNIIVNPEYIPLHQVMRPLVHVVAPESSRDEVVDLVERYKIPALPVISDKDKLVGVITYEEVVEAIEDIADETIASIAGTGDEVGEHIPILSRIFARAPWLLVTLCAGMTTATVMKLFGEAYWFVGIVPFVTLIAGMSGNVGLQCSTVLVRSMSTGEISSGSKQDAIFSELSIGISIGVLFGILSGTLAFVLNSLGIQDAGQPTAVGLTVGCGVFSACMTATTLGVFFPFFFARIGIDPAVASGPLVTAFNDVTSTFTFFVIAWSIFSYLGG